MLENAVEKRTKFNIFLNNNNNKNKNPRNCLGPK
jgi:hypothetical protein